MRIHYRIKPFVCSYCDKSFNEKGNLKTHIRIHTGERPFKCKLCYKGFKALGQLKDHLISHTGYKPFQCPHCKKFYRRKEILKNHIIIHSKEEFFKNNKEKYDEILNEVIKMKHIKHNLDELETINKNNNDINSTSYNFKKEVGLNNFKTFYCFSPSCNSKDEKIINLKNIKSENNENGNFENLIDLNGKLSEDFLMNNKLFKDDCYNVWPNEINNLLSSTECISIKDEKIVNEQNKFKFEKKNFDFQKSDNSLGNMNIKSNNLYITFYDNNLENNNKHENDECSNMTNLYYNEYERKNYMIL